MSSASDAPPPVTPVIDQRIEDCLRRVTAAGLNHGNFTVNKARAAAEHELGLDAGFFKQDPMWKAKSKEVIQITVDGGPLAGEAELSATAKPAARAGTKRKSDTAPARKQQPRKRLRKSESEDELSEPDLDDDDDEPEAQATPSDDDDFSDAKPAKKAPAKRRTTQKKAKAVSDDESDAKPKRKAPVKRRSGKKAEEKVVEESEASDLEEKELSPAPRKSEEDVKSEAHNVKEEESELSDAPSTDKADTNGKAPQPEDDESDMSVLIDEPPKRKRASKAAAQPKAKTKTTKATKAKSTTKALSPDEEEIKRLQGWLVKCGIRKLWHRELADYDTPKPKIKHLRKMLEDAGMTGRYSNEKAKDIKERRELAAELEAAQEYARKWGQDKDARSDDDDEEDDEDRSGKGEQLSEEELKPAKRKPKGLVDFGDSGDDGSD